jgi:hypothetical protein
VPVLKDAGNGIELPTMGHPHAMSGQT